LEDLNGNQHINKAWQNIKEGIKISAKWSVVLFVWKQHKPWFGEDV